MAETDKQNKIETFFEELIAFKNQKESISETDLEKVRSNLLDLLEGNYLTRFKALNFYEIYEDYPNDNDEVPF